MVVDPVAALTATALMFYGLNFFVLGMVLLGYGQLKDAGPIFLFAGGINGLIALNVFSANLAAGEGDFVIVAFLLLIFAITWLAAGVVAMMGGDVVPIGSLGIFFGLAMIPFAAFLLQSEVPARIWLTVNVISWIWVFFTLPLAFVFKKISAKIAGWSFLIQAFYTLWIPSALLIAGVAIP
ncbi:MAG: AmiS/UreI family transporter [Dehalococcoidia bacterium]